MSFTIPGVIDEHMWVPPPHHVDLPLPDGTTVRAPGLQVALVWILWSIIAPEVAARGEGFHIAFTGRQSFILKPVCTVLGHSWTIEVTHHGDILMQGAPNFREKVATARRVWVRSDMYPHPHPLDPSLDPSLEVACACG